MTILWCGCEDIDFPVGYYSISTDSTYFDNTYSRSCIKVNGGYANFLLNQDLTDLWLSSVVYHFAGGANCIGLGMGNSSNNAWIGIGLGSSEDRIALLRYDGSAVTRLYDGDPYSIIHFGLNKIDINISDYGISGNIKVYNNGTLCIDYTGDLTALSNETLNMVSLRCPSYQFYYSEIIVADEDTRLMRLKTLSPSSAGDANDWTGAYTDIDETTLSDSDKIYSATNNADFQTNLTGMPLGTWSVKAVKIAARCVDGSGTTGIQLGVKSGGTVDSGTTQTASGYWQTKERLMNINPVTGNAFTPAEIDALQVNLRSVTL